MISMMPAKSSEVLIVGAGLIGSAIAWRLAQAGVAVQLVDAGVMGGEASSAGAGMLSPGGEFPEHSVWLHLGINGMRMFPSFVEELQKESGVAIDFRICGTQYFAVSDAERAAARSLAEFHTSFGIRVEINSKGLFYPEDASVNPVDLLSALRTACERRGVRIVESHPLSSIDAGEFRAVVIAAGAWSGQLSVLSDGRPLALPATVPIKGHLIGFDLAPGTLATMLRHHQTYVIQRANGFTIAGSNEQQVGFDRSIDPAICEEIQRQAWRLYPALEGLTPSKSWIGFRPRDASGSGPHMERVPGTNVWLAYGHYRNGILLAPLTAERISSDIAAQV